MAQNGGLFQSLCRLHRTDPRSMSSGFTARERSAANNRQRSFVREARHSTTIAKAIGYVNVGIALGRGIDRASQGFPLLQAHRAEDAPNQMLRRLSAPATPKIRNSGSCDDSTGNMKSCCPFTMGVGAFTRGAKLIGSISGDNGRVNLHTVVAGQVKCLAHGPKPRSVKSGRMSL